LGPLEWDPVNSLPTATRKWYQNQKNQQQNQQQKSVSSSCSPFFHFAEADVQDPAAVQKAFQAAMYAFFGAPTNLSRGPESVSNKINNTNSTVTTANGTSAVNTSTTALTPTSSNHSHSGFVTLVVNCAGRAQPYSLLTQINPADPSPHPNPNSTALAENVRSRLKEFDEYLSSHLKGAFVVTETARAYFPPPVVTNTINDNSAQLPRDVSIIHISSIRAHSSEPFTEGYAAAKGGLIALTHAQAQSFGEILKQEFEKHDANSIFSTNRNSNSNSPQNKLAPLVVRVNSISPGWVDTSGEDELIRQDHMQHTVGRVGVPRDVAEMVLFLSDSRKSSFITGQNFVVDGGVSTRMRAFEGE